MQLGGLNYYGGEPAEHPRMGDPARPLERADISRANALMLTAATLALLVFNGARAAALELPRLCTGGPT